MEVPDDLSSPAGFDDEDGAFHLPMAGLFADLEAGSGAVQLPDEFLSADPQVQWRIVGDWMRGLALLQQRLQSSLPVQQAE